jgi:hypothetical protein
MKSSVLWVEGEMVGEDAGPVLRLYGIRSDSVGAERKEIGQDTDCLAVTLLCRLPDQVDAKLPVLGSPLSQYVHEAQVILAVRIAMLGSPLVPANRRTMTLQFRPIAKVSGRVSGAKVVTHMSIAQQRSGLLNGQFEMSPDHV